MKHLKMLSISLFCSSMLFPFCPSYSYDSNTNIVRAKLSDPSVNYKRELNQGGNAQLPQVRKITLRDSGRNESLMLIENTNFRDIGDIGFYVPHLTLTLKPNNPASPVIFDDPTSFSLHIHQGSVVLSDTSLDALFNDYVFNVPGATIKDVKVTTSPGVLTLNGHMFRGTWIPFMMKGTLSVQGTHIINFKPNVVLVNGVDATKVLHAANVRLDELLKMKAIGATLVGSNIVLDANKLFPPPALSLTLKSAKVISNGLVLSFDDGKHPSISKIYSPSSSHIIIRGGDLRFMRTMPLNAALQINSTEDSKLDFCLYRYREQLSRGYLVLGHKGEIHAFFPKPNCAY